MTNREAALREACPTCGGPVRPSSVCVCGLARDYHADRFGGPKDHKYERRYFAATPEPPRETEGLAAALQAVWDLGDELDSNHTRFAAGRVAERFGVELRYHNDFSEPPRNRNEEQHAADQAEIDQLTKALAAARSVTPLEGLPNADILGMALDLVDEEDARQGVIGRGRKVDRVVAKYAALASAPTAGEPDD